MPFYLSLVALASSTAESALLSLPSRVVADLEVLTLRTSEFASLDHGCLRVLLLNDLRRINQLGALRCVQLTTIGPACRRIGLLNIATRATLAKVVVAGGALPLCAGRDCCVT